MFAAGAIVCAAIDLVSKWWVFSALTFQKAYAVIPGLLDFYPTENRGGVFGIAQGSSWLFVIVTLVILGVLFWMFFRFAHSSLPATSALALLVGGALGNLWDRLFHGAVRDFIFFHVGGFKWFPFNVADAFLCVGAAVLAIYLLRNPTVKPAKSAKPARPAKR